MESTCYVALKKSVLRWLAAIQMNIYIAVVWVSVAAVSRDVSSDTIVGTIVVVDVCWRRSWLTVLRIVLVFIAVPMLVMLVLVIIVVTVSVPGVSKCRVGRDVYLWVGIQRWVNVYRSIYIHRCRCDVIVFNRDVLRTALLGCRAYPDRAADRLWYLVG